MTIEDLFDRTLNDFDRRLQAVAETQWDAPTPCSEWRVRDLVNHAVNQARWIGALVAGKTVEEVGDAFDGDLLGDDPKLAWKHAADDALTTITESGALERTVHHSSGDLPARLFLSVAASDLIVHIWDLARAIGYDDTLDPELVELATSSLEAVVDGWRAAGSLGEPVVVPESADAQTKLLALVGRAA